MTADVSERCIYRTALKDGKLQEVGNCPGGTDGSEVLMSLKADFGQRC
jgi:hypothetical protein